MIKKINEIIEDMPILIKLIIGIILTTISVTMFYFINIAKVSAATYTYEMNGCSSYEKDSNYPNGHWQGHGYATNGSCTVTNNDSNNMISAFDGWFENYTNGVGTGYITVEMNTLNNNMTCNSLRNSLRILVGGNDIVNSSTGWTCSQQLFKTTFTQSFSLNVPVTQNALDIIVSSTNWTYWSNYTMTGQVTIEEPTSITNEDLNNTAMGIINQAIANALDIINNATDNRNAITTMLQTLTNSIYGNVVDAINNTNKHCETININNIEHDNTFLNGNGNEQTLNSWGITDYIEIKDKEFKYKELYQVSDTSTYRCYYNKNKVKLTCEKSNNETITIPNNSYYVRLSINKEIDRPQYSICQSKEEWQNEQEQNRHDQLMDKIREIDEMYEDESDEQKGLLSGIINSITGLFNFFNDDDIDNPDLSSLGSNVGSNGVITDLLLLPVSLWQKVILSINGTCQTFVIGELWGTNLTMPCIHLENVFGQTLWSVFDVILSGFLLWNIRKHFIKIFNNLTSLKTGGNELE